MSVDVLILGSGWTSNFLIPLCNERGITYAATTRDGRNGTLKWQFDPESDSDHDQLYKQLPDAITVLITFPITKKGGSARLLELYLGSRSEQAKGRSFNFIQLGATTIWDGQRKDVGQTNNPPPVKLVEHRWYDRLSPTTSTPRGDAEDELLALSTPEHPMTVLNLAGLWGGTRSMKNWVGRVAPTKEVLKQKGSLHMIHGLDVARAILAVHDQFEKAQGQRWLLTDGRVYDWWDLASAWGSAPASTIQSPIIPASKNGEGTDRGPQPLWVQELMDETGVRGLPRDVAFLGRALDSREFWDTFQLCPVKARLD